MVETMNNHDTEKIVDKIIRGLTEDDIQYIKSLKCDNLWSLHHTLGQSIRNDYNFWEMKWEPELIDGVDHSPYHPDNYSMTIITLIYEKLTN